MSTLPPDNPVPKYCSQCGQPIPEGHIDCAACGAAIVAAPTPIAAPTPPTVVVVAPGINGLAVASLVLGILWLYWLGSILAIIFGHVALNQIRRNPHGSQGKGMAIAGLVLGYAGIVVFVILLVVVAVFFPQFNLHRAHGAMV